MVPFLLCLRAASFNPHTHEGCDDGGGRGRPGRGVSIHTPTKGVTAYCKMAPWLGYVSIHTPTKGVTHRHQTHPLHLQVSIHTPTKGVTLVPRSPSCLLTVSIHTPTKGVTDDVTNKTYTEQVSIHTPTKGVTLYFFIFLIHFNCFNPHTHEGCDTYEQRISR